jgi:hypothetical protein
VPRRRCRRHPVHLPEVWYSAGAAARYDARDGIATLTNRRVIDRLRGIDASGRHGVHSGVLEVAADRQDQPLTVADYDTHIHRELTALLGADGATIRTSPGIFTRIDNLDHALVTIAAATRAAATGPQLTGRHGRAARCRSASGRCTRPGRCA